MTFFCQSEKANLQIKSPQIIIAACTKFAGFQNASFYLVLNSFGKYIGSHFPIYFVSKNLTLKLSFHTLFTHWQCNLEIITLIKSNQQYETLQCKICPALTQPKFMVFRKGLKVFELELIKCWNKFKNPSIIVFTSKSYYVNA